MITTVNVGDIVTALVEQIGEFSAVRKLNPTIERSEKNDDPGRCPWICVYRFRVSYTPRVLGMGSGFRYQDVTLGVAVQESDPTSGEQCEARVEALLQAVTSAILSDATIKGTVNSLAEDFEVQYPDYQKKDGRWMQTALIQFTAQTVVGG